jgi:hypothetical protein
MSLVVTESAKALAKACLGVPLMKDRLLRHKRHEEVRPSDPLLRP